MVLVHRFGFALMAAAWANAHANPVRKVVSLLQNMQKKVEEEGSREAELYKKFDCYCKTGKGDLAGSISAAEDKSPAVTSDIEGAEARLTGAKSTLKQAKADRSAAEAAMSEASSIRKDQSSAFAKLKADHEANIDAVAKATSAVSNGLEGSFLQTPASQIIQNAVSKLSLVETEVDEMNAFLSQSKDYTPQSGEVLGILKQMGESMAAALSDATSAEEEAISSHKDLMAAKKKEIGALTATIERKMGQIGELGVSIVQMKDDLSDTQATLLQDKKFMAELEQGCSTKAADMEERSKTRSAEVVALADTIKILNDDDALELFKKTLPSAGASFLQIQEGMSTVRAKALAVLRSAKASAATGDRAGLEMLMLSLIGKARAKGGFEKVITMIDDMVALLGKEQTQDTDKKEYCTEQLDRSEDKQKELERTISDEDSSIANAKEATAKLTQELEATEAGIRSLDKAVATATAQRKDENAEYKELMSSDGAAQELLGIAKNRLNKFYNPKLYKPPTKTQSEGDMGGPTFTQVSLHSQQKGAPPPPPETFGAYTTKSGESSGVVAMMDLLITDLKNEMTEAETQEKDSQAEYEEMMKDSAVKRTTDSKSLTEKESTKAAVEAELQDHTLARADGAKELMATARYQSSLHGECDWLVQYFDVRKEARAGEVESLHKAKAVLSGADYSLIQTSRSHAFLQRH